MSNIFDRTISLLGEEEFSRISNLKVLVVGLGGVGGTACEAVARLGVNNIGIVDSDCVDITNINRQIISNTSNVGKYKTDLFEERIKSINSNCVVRKHTLFLNKESMQVVFKDNYDYVIDCIDSLESKIDLYKYCIENNIKIISSMGTANKLNPTKLVITTLNKSSEDKLAKKVRELCRKEDIDLKKINIVYSPEPKRVEVNKPLPSYMLVPSVAGLYCVYYIVDDLLNNNK